MVELGETSTNVTSQLAEEYKLTVFFGRTYVEPELPGWLIDELFSVENCEYYADHNGRIRSKSELRVMCDYDFGGKLHFPTGLARTVCRRLRAAGCQVRVQDQREYPKETFQVRMSFAQLAKGVLRQIARAVRKSGSGQIEIANQRECLAAMGLICRMYPDTRVLMLASTNQSARDLRWKLMQQEGLKAGYKRKGGKARLQIHVPNPMGGWHLDQREIVLLPEPLAAINEKGAITMGDSSFTHAPCRTYSFLKPGTQLTLRERLRLEACSGPVIHRVENERLGVQVVWIATPSCRRIAAESPLEFKRQAYWNNARRNQTVAAVATALHTGHQNRLLRYGFPPPFVDKAVSEQMFRVVVLVESSEHADALADRLPEFQVFSLGRGRQDDPLTPHGRIMTMAWARASGFNAEVVVLASGELAHTDMKGYPPIRMTDDDADAFVVDFVDDFDVRAKARAEQRKQEAKIRGWETAWAIKATLVTGGTPS